MLESKNDTGIWSKKSSSLRLALGRTQIACDKRRSIVGEN